MTKSKNTLRKMVISGISYNLLVAMERELIFYTDGMLKYAANHGAALGDGENDVQKKFDNWELIAEMSQQHCDMHIQVLGTISTIKALTPPPPVDQADISLSIPQHLFDIMLNAFNSPFLTIKNKDDLRSFWYVLGDSPQRPTYLKYHQELQKQLKSATSLLVADEEEDEEELDESDFDSEEYHIGEDERQTMPTPYGRQ